MQMMRWSDVKAKMNSIAICTILFASLLLSLNLQPGSALMPYIVTLVLQLGICMIVLSLTKISLHNSMIISLLLLFLVMVWFATTSLFSDYTSASFSRFLLAFIPGFGLYVLVLLDRSPLDTFIKIMKGLVLSGVLLAVIGILLYMFGTEKTIEEGFVQEVVIGGMPFSQLTIPANGFTRISSLLGNPNNLGFMMFLALMATFALRALKKLRAGLFWPVVLVLLSALFMTFSRANMLTFMLASVMLFLLFSTGIVSLVKRMYWAACALIIGAILVLQIFPFELLDAFNRSSGLAGREVSWIVALQTIQHNFMTGIGFAAAEQELLKAGLSISTHNSHLSILMETGVLGYALFFALWIFGILTVIRNLYRAKATAQSRDIIIVYSTVLTLLMAMFIHQMFETKIPYAGVPTLFWFYFLGLSVKRLNNHS